MLTREEARQAVSSLLGARAPWMAADDEWMILDSETIERSWGWVFFHTSKRWHETQAIGYAVAGNAPHIVERVSGRLFQLGTSNPVEHYIGNYERNGDPHDPTA